MKNPLQMILQFGDAEGNTALHHAAMTGPDCVSPLLNAGADVLIKNLDRKTASEVAKRQDIKERLRKHGVLFFIFYFYFLFSSKL